MAKKTRKMAAIVLTVCVAISAIVTQTQAAQLVGQDEQMKNGAVEQWLDHEIMDSSGTTDLMNPTAIVTSDTGTAEPRSTSPVTTDLSKVSKKKFTFDVNAEDVKAENNNYIVEWARIGSEGLLKVTADAYTGGDYQTFKLVMPTDTASEKAYKGSTHVSYDIIFPKEAVQNAANANAAFWLVIATNANGWWKDYNGNKYYISDMIPHGSDYYMLSVSEDITDSTRGQYAYTGGPFYIQPLADGFTCSGPIYVDNIEFYAQPVSAQSIILNKPAIEVGVTGVESLTATVTPANTYDKTITWTSSDPSKVMVDSNGEITAVAKTGAGMPVVITATSADGNAQATCEVTVVDKIPSTSVVLSESTATLQAGWGITKKLTATVKPDNVTNKKVVWTSSNEAVAKVRNGVITAIGAGTAKIRATANDSNGAVYAECTITVNPASTTSLGDGSRRIKVDGTDFVVGYDNKTIWMNGANTPWNQWDEFGGGDRYSFNEAWWDNHFEMLHDSGVNSSRVWFLCSGDYGVQFDEDGYCIGVDAEFWNRAGKLFEIAKKHEIYIMATLSSFDCWVTKGHDKDTWKKWEAMIQDSDKIDSYVENYVIPFVNRFGSSDYLWSIDICNEIDWVYEDSSKINVQSWDNISDFIARNAVGIHQNSDVLVTVGLASTKYNADPSPYIGNGIPDAHEGNKLSDSYLESFISNQGLKNEAHMDFWSSHYYAWEAPWFGNPFAAESSAQYGLVGKPAVIGETAAVGSGWSRMYADESTGWAAIPGAGAKEMSSLDDYMAAMDIGYNGVMAWTSNSVDNCGGFEDMEDAVNYIADQYTDLVFPYSADKIHLMIDGSSVNGTIEIPDAASGYAPLSPITVTVAKMPGAANTTGLAVTLSGSDKDNFVLGALSGGGNVTDSVSSTFTIKPKDNLPVGTYNATIAVTGDGRVRLQHSVTFTVSGTDTVMGNRMPKGTVYAGFTFDNGTDGIVNDGGASSAVKHTVLGRENVLEATVKWQEGNPVKLKLPFAGFADMYKMATHFSYDVYLPKKDFENQNGKFQTYFTTDKNSWDQTRGDVSTIEDAERGINNADIVTLGGVEYYRFMKNIDISEDVNRDPSQWYVVGIMDPWLGSPFNYNGPIYFDNLYFYNEDTLIGDRTPGGTVYAGFTFDSDSQGVTNGSGCMSNSVSQAQLGRESVLKVDVTWVDWNPVKLVLPNISTCQSATNFSYDVLLPKEAFNAATNVQIQTFFVTNKNGGWDQGRGDNAFVTGSEVVKIGGIEYYRITNDVKVSNEINGADWCNFGIMSISGGLSYEGPIYFDNLYFYTPY